MAYAIVGLFFMGFGVGCRFKVAAMVVASLAIVLFNILLHQLTIVTWDIALSTLAFLVSFQAGYIAGIFLSTLVIRKFRGE
jgi:hypothetical protein